MKHVLPELAYKYGDLEPYIDAKTMEIHHSKHHQAYVNNLNAVLEKYPDLQDKKLEDLMRNLKTLEMEDADRTALRNHGGGHMNHSLYWDVMGPKPEVDMALVDDISKEFGSVDKFKEAFTKAAATQFGSGWAWLVRDDKGKLQIYSTGNQDSPYLQNHTPIMCIDVWEHAYYLKYQNKRPEYIDNWWHVLKLI